MRLARYTAGIMKRALGIYSATEAQCVRINADKTANAGSLLLQYETT